MEHYRGGPTLSELGRRLPDPRTIVNADKMYTNHTNMPVQPFIALDIPRVHPEPLTNWEVEMRAELEITKWIEEVGFHIDRRKRQLAIAKATAWTVAIGTGFSGFVAALHFLS